MILKVEILSLQETFETICWITIESYYLTILLKYLLTYNYLQ